MTPCCHSWKRAGPVGQANTSAAGCSTTVLAMAGAMSAAPEQGGVPGQVERPSLVAVDAVADRLPAGTVPVEVAVLQFDPGPVRSLGHEPDLDLAAQLRVGLDLPLRADVPAEDHAGWWLVGQDPRPPAFAAVDATVVDVPADVGLEDCLGDRGREQVVLRRLEVAEPLGERCEGLLGRRVDHHLLADNGDLGSGHGLSSVACPATST